MGRLHCGSGSAVNTAMCPLLLLAAALLIAGASIKEATAKPSTTEAQAAAVVKALPPTAKRVDRPDLRKQREANPYPWIERKEPRK